MGRAGMMLTSAIATIGMLCGTIVMTPMAMAADSGSSESIVVGGSQQWFDLTLTPGTISETSAGLLRYSFSRVSTIGPSSFGPIDSVSMRMGAVVDGQSCLSKYSKGCKTYSQTDLTVSPDDWPADIQGEFVVTLPHGNGGGSGALSVQLQRIASSLAKNPEVIGIDFRVVGAYNSSGPGEAVDPVSNIARVAIDHSAKPDAAPDRTKLTAAITKAEGLKQNDYMAYSWDRLTAALKHARSVQSDANATQDSIDEAARTLTDVINTMRPKSGTPLKPSEQDLTDDTRAATLIQPASTEAGSSLTLHVDGQYSGGKVDVYLFPESIQIAQASVVGASGAASVTMPVGTATGEHRIVVKPYVEADITIWDTVMVTAASSDGSKVPVYRLYNPFIRQHLYTADEHEKTVLSAPGGGWTDESIAFYVIRANAGDVPANTKPVYRLYNERTKRHLVTLDSHEKDVLTSERGWTFENIAWYQSNTGTVPVYRLYSSITDEHLYTTDFNEYQVNGARGWKQEKIAWMGL